MRAPLLRLTNGSRARPAALVMILALLVGGSFVQRGTRGDEPSAYESARLFDEVRQHVLRDFVDTVSADRVYRNALDGMLYELNDPHSAFLSPDRLEQLDERKRGNYVGVGLQVDIRDDWLIVMSPMHGSPAERAGFEPGDRIVSIDGKSTENWTLEEAGTALRGPVGSRVTLVVERIGAATPFEVTLRRARVHVNAVRRATMLTRDVGYIELGAFSDSSAVEVGRAITDLRRAGMQSLMLDLRTNPGGLLEQGVRVADLFLDRQAAILRTRGRTPADSHDYVDEAAQRWPNLPLTVLVDDRTASAAEIVAGALQDHDRAAIVGIPTYGKGSAQTVFRLAGGALKLTTARWYTPAGRSIARREERPSEFGLVDDEPRQRPRYKTLSGRVVRGGGGIVPDVIAGDTIGDPAEAVLSAAVAGKARQFRDALSDVALRAKRTRAVRSADFTVTPEMLDALHDAMQRRGIDMPRVSFDQAAPALTRMLTYEIARFVFGPEVEFRRRAGDDRPLRVALRIATGARSARDPLQRIAEAQAAQLAEPRG